MLDTDQTLDETKLTPADAPSPFLPNTQIQYAWDSTSLGLIKTCPRLYQYTILEGWASRDENIHLYFGSEYHAALEAFDRAIAEGMDREAAVSHCIGELVHRVWDWNPDPTTKAGRYKNRDSLVGLVVDYLDHFNPDPAETYIKSDGSPAVELSFRFELDYGPETAAVGYWENKFTNERRQTGTTQPYLLCGHLDRVVSFNSQLFILDRKTTTTTLGPHYFAQYSPNNQMSLYTFAGRIMMSTIISGIIIDAAQIKLEEPNAFARGLTYRTEAQLTEWQDDLRTTLALAETYALNNYWPMNDTSCDKYGGCKFRSICSADPHVRPNFLKTDFTKLPEDQRWNPLATRGPK